MVPLETAGGNHSVRLGLLLAGSGNPEQPFGSLTAFARTVSCVAGEEGVGVICLDPAGLEKALAPAMRETGPGPAGPETGRRRDEVLGWRFRDPARGWEQVHTALPEVLWNRYLRRSLPDRWLHALKQRGIPVFNPPALSKWESDLCLRAAPDLAYLLPETRLLTHAETLYALLGEYREVYMKPVSGSVGRGIVQIRRGECDTLLLRYVSGETGGVRELCATGEQLQRWMDRGRAGRFILQQGLDLRVFYGRPADVRVLVQKDGEGLWRVTGMGARVAAHGRFTANLHTGGHGVPLEMLTEAVFPADAYRQEALAAQLAHYALLVARQVESWTGEMGEVGIDFGIGRDGRIWFIEQNGLPGRNLFAEIGRPDLSRIAHLRPVQFAAWLIHRKRCGQNGDITARCRIGWDGDSGVPPLPEEEDVSCRRFDSRRS